MGVIGFLNARPLVYALENNLIHHDFEMQYDVPSVCADRLLNRQIEVATIPSFEYANHSGQYQIVPEICISSRGAVKSVCLFFHKGLRNIKRVAVDTSSRTSVILTKIILHEKFLIDPEYIPMKSDLNDMLTHADAALLIGDRALASHQQYPNALDLGEEWTDLTGLPFVYAFWAGRPGSLNDQEVDILKQAKEVGLRQINAIASRHAEKSDVPVETVQNYLTENLRFTLDGEALDGLREFYEQAFFYGFIKGIPNLSFFKNAIETKELRNQR